MRWGTLLIVASVLVGCAAKAPAPQASTWVHAPIYEEAVTASLAYDPPATAAGPWVEVPREGRGNQAYAGYEDVISTYYWLRVDDRQVDYGANGVRGGQGSRGRWSGDRYERRAISTRVGVTHR